MSGEVDRAAGGDVEMEIRVGRLDEAAPTGILLMSEGGLEWHRP